jgi:hypothetical protein
MPDPQTPTPPAPTTSWDAWLERDRYTITLPSGAVVKIQLLELPDHFMLGDTPDGLRRAAVGELGQKLQQGGDALTEDERDEMMATIREYYARVVADSLLDPAPPEGMSAADVSASLPERDRDLLLKIQQRATNEDAAGQRLPFQTLEELARFRGERDGAAGGAADEAVGAGVPANREARRRARAVPGRGGRDAAK